MNHFWKKKTLSQMTPLEWESLCDGCGKCCLNKIIDEDTEELHFTTVACHLLHSKTCQCKKYEQRLKIVPDCVKAWSTKNLVELRNPNATRPWQHVMKSKKVNLNKAMLVKPFNILDDT